MTKANFLKAYEARIVASHAWAKDMTRLATFMRVASETLSGVSGSWDHRGGAAVEAWHDIGGKGKPTLKALRALVD
jgi:hypothetical protein